MRKIALIKIILLLIIIFLFCGCSESDKNNQLANLNEISLNEPTSRGLTYISSDIPPKEIYPSCSRVSV